DDRAARPRRAGFLVLHGFGSNKDSGVSVAVAKLLAGFGYAALRFDFRGCGESEGPRGRVICLEQVEDTRQALSFLATRSEVDPIPPGLRGNLSQGSIMEFPFEVVESMYTFRANDVVGDIAPRPLLLLHSARDSVTPTEQSIDLFMRAGQPTDLHLVAEVDH